MDIEDLKRTSLRVIKFMASSPYSVALCLESLFSTMAPRCSVSAMQLYCVCACSVYMSMHVLYKTHVSYDRGTTS